MSRKSSSDSKESSSIPEGIEVDLITEQPVTTHIDISDSDKLPIKLTPVDVNIPLEASKLVKPQDWKERRDWLRERAGLGVALMLVLSFTGVILLIPIICIFVMYNLPADNAKAFAESLNPLLEKFRDLASGVFGPLLAFVLGYYFSKEQREAPSRER